MAGIASQSVPPRPSAGALRYPVDDQWRAHVRSWLAEQARRPDGMSQTALAKSAKIAAPTLNGLLSGKYDHSHAVPLINKMVGLPPPVTAKGTSDEGDVGMQLDAALASLDDEDREAVRVQAEGLVRLARALAEKRRRNDS